MKKRLGSLALAAFLLLQFLIPAALAFGFQSFQTIRTYPAGKFQDVPSGEWYTSSVKTAYELGLFDGKSSVIFDPNGNLTIAEALKLAVCLHSIYHYGTADFNMGASPWYAPYVEYALEKGIIKSGYSNYNKMATRTEFAVIFAAALPNDAFPVINRVDDNAIPDISMQDVYAKQVYQLYRAGILIGSNSKGAFNPQSNITRSEVATIVTRMAMPEKRQTVTLKYEVLSAEEVFSKCASAVFYIEVYDASGKAFASGSGFFLTASGMAVTNQHVIEGAKSAKIRTSNGKTYAVKGLYDSSKTLDLALLQIDGSGFAYLDRGDTSALKSGAKIYTIGSPLGLENTISEGIISNPDRILDGQHYIQITAPISHGSSGGALLNQMGQVIGVTSGGFAEGQNLNVAIPVHLVDQLSKTTVKPLGNDTPSPGTLRLTASQNTVSMKKGESQTVTFYVSGDDSQVTSILYTINDKTVVSGSWGSWSNNWTQIPLTLTGVGAGSTTVKIDLTDKDKRVLFSVTLSVSVSNANSTQYYSGFYPVPDYGAYTGAPLYYQAATSSGDQGYFYRLQDLPEATIAVNGYISLLEQNGFVYETGFTSDQGYTILVFLHNGKQLVVYFGVTKLGGVPCMHILITTK
ncbi:MAG: trypsin-like peptidase domain-containing protein [Oscillospiraceae bacterium]